MNTLQAVLQKKKFNQKENILKPTDNCQLDDLLDELTSSGLINQQFRAWYSQRARTLGLDLFRILSRVAVAEGREPAKYFSYLIKHGYRTYLPNVPKAHQAGIKT